VAEAAEENPPEIRQRTFEFAVRVVKLCHHLSETPGVGRTLSVQLLKAGTYVGANVEEAYAAQSKADFISKYSIALKESRESHYWLRLLAESSS
jgi:four helix bundle protein